MKRAENDRKNARKTILAEEPKSSIHEGNQDHGRVSK